MFKEFTYSVIPKASVRPNKIVVYKQFIKNIFATNSTKGPKKTDEQNKKSPSDGQTTLFPTPLRPSFVTMVDQPAPKPVQVTKSNKHNFEISYKAACAIKEKGHWLFELAKNRTVIGIDGKPNSTFKCSFITLTMPSTQIHSTKDITKTCLNQFLTECREQHGLQNYVWRLEFQKIGLDRFWL